MKPLTFAAMMLLAAMMTAQTKNNAPDTIFVNGNIWPGACLFGSGASSQFAQALAVRDGRIVAVGTNDEIRKLKGKKTAAVDLGGNFVMPGFNDAHLHLSGGGLDKLIVDLVGTKSLVEMQQRIAAYEKKIAPGQWIIGRGWDHTKWNTGESRLPNRKDLDAVTGDHPAFFVRVDGHIAVANSAALKIAGITGDTKNPNGGKIDRDESGEPTGILREGAMELVRRKIPPPTLELRRKAIELALAEAAEWGVTSIQDASSVGSPEGNAAGWQDFLIYEDLEREGKLTARISMWLPFDADLNTLQQHRAHHQQTDAMLHTGQLKGYMDGSLGSRTAALLAPYADDPSNTGLAQYEPANLNEMASERAAAGFQLGFHAIGDGGAQLALDSFAEAERFAREHNAGAADRRGFRNRIEHGQVLTPQQVQTMASMKVIASVQPNHLLTDMMWAEQRLAATRAKTSYPWRDLIRHGVPVAFGTDYPVEPITPFRGVYSAVTRKNEEGTKTYYPEQALTITEALAAYTTGSAYAEFAEADKGLLAPGMLADFVVLDRDLTKVKPQEILATKVLRTVVGGKSVYQAK